MKINLGCGDRLMAGWTNVDLYPSHPSVVLADLNNRLPFDNECAEEVLLDNVIEHVSSVTHVIQEIHRVLKPQGKLRIITPHYSSPASWRDPTHTHHFSYFSFDYFTKNRGYLGNVQFSIESKKLSFGGGWSLIGRLIFLASEKAYEKYFTFIFPASTIHVVLQKN
jgi:SAM-dependent methyltransferase